MAKTPAEVRKIAMDDGREVEFTGKKRLDKTVLVTDSGASVRLDFVNGETRTFAVPSSLLYQFAAHGASQKLGDEISDVTDIEDAIEVIDQLMQRLEKGQWFANREGTASGLSGASILAKALVKVTGQPIAVVREYLGGLDNKTKAALRVSAEVAPAVKALEDEKAARAAAKGATAAPAVDTAALLGALRDKAAA